MRWLRRTLGTWTLVTATFEGIQLCELMEAAILAHYHRDLDPPKTL